MNPTRFDQLAYRLTASTDRRQALTAIAAGSRGKAVHAAAGWRAGTNMMTPGHGMVSGKRVSSLPATGVGVSASLPQVLTRLVLGATAVAAIFGAAKSRPTRDGDDPMI
jgi:hypothetical protein